MISWVCVEHWRRCLQDKDTRAALPKSQKLPLKHLKQHFCSFWVPRGGPTRLFYSQKFRFAIIFTQNDQKRVKIHDFSRAGPGRAHVEGSKCNVAVIFLDFFALEMCLGTCWMWAGQLPVPGSNGALPNTSRSLQNSKNKKSRALVPPSVNPKNDQLFPYRISPQFSNRSYALNFYFHD